MKDNKQITNAIINLTKAYEMAYMIFDSHHFEDEDIDLNMEHGLVAILDYIEKLKELRSI